jgi:LmbE family N-acetylglucosaminyl deacetylase
VDDKLMVVAHPDDETIFGGAHLLREKHWKVVCITNANNKKRTREFVKVMRLVEADYEIWNYRDTYSCRFDIVSLKRDLRRLIRQNQFEKVVTHGLQGEYGHPQHKVIARIMRNIVKHNLYAFSIGQETLPEKFLNEKMKLLDVYRSQKHTIWELCRHNSLHDYIEKEHFILVKK